MATFKRATKIPARPQIKAVQQPIPRQVILPQKAQPVVFRNIRGKKTSVAPTNVPMRPTYNVGEKIKDVPISDPYYPRPTTGTRGTLVNDAFGQDLLQGSKS